MAMLIRAVLYDNAFNCIRYLSVTCVQLNWLLICMLHVIPSDPTNQRGPSAGGPLCLLLGLDHYY